MFPILYKIGPVTLYSYGLMLAISAIVCSWALSRDARRVGISSEIIYDFFFWIVVFGLLGARLFYVILNLDFFLNNPFEIIMIQNGGLAWQGGLVLGALAGVGFIKKRKLDLRQMLDLSAPYIALGEAMGRIGCFFNGCCYGKEASWGIYFPVHHARLHPTQLYTCAGLLVIFLVLKRFQKYSHDSGRVFVLYLVLASIWRFGVEFFRADHVEVLYGLSIYQIVSFFFLLVAIYVYTILKSRRS